MGVIETVSLIILNSPTVVGPDINLSCPDSLINEDFHLDSSRSFPVFPLSLGLEKDCVLGSLGKSCPELL